MIKPRPSKGTRRTNKSKTTRISTSISSPESMKPRPSPEKIRTSEENPSSTVKLSAQATPIKARQAKPSHRFFMVEKIIRDREDPLRPSLPQENPLRLS